MEILLRYFPDLSERQRAQLEQLLPLYRDWNEKINVVSRKDIDNLYERHILHSMAIAKWFKFVPGSEIIDVGTGGGLPGIPLAILFPEARFELIDGTAKKIRVAEAIIEALELKNAKAKPLRSEQVKHRFDFVTARAVTRLDKLLTFTRPLLRRKHRNPMPNGLLTLKGGDVESEIKLLPPHEYAELYALADVYEEPFFETKYLVYVQG